jgi:hypothetical protein
MSSTRPLRFEGSEKERMVGQGTILSVESFLLLPSRFENQAEPSRMVMALLSFAFCYPIRPMRCDDKSPLTPHARDA